MSPVRHILISLIMLIAVPGSGMAALNYLDFQDISIPMSIDGIYINPLTGAISLTPPADLETAPWLNFFSGGTGIGSNSRITPVITSAPTGNGDGIVLKVLSLQEIGTAMHYAQGPNGSENHTGIGASQFQSGVPGYLGFAFRSTVGSPVNFGWLQLTVNSNGSGILHDRAYETISDTSLLAGAVPEPSSCALLLFGTMCFAFSRRR